MAAQREAVGSVAGLYVATTKGFAVRKAPSVKVAATGIAGNREFFLVDVDERLYSVPKDPAFLSLWTSYDPSTRRFAVGRGDTLECESVIEHDGDAREFEFDERRVVGWWTPGPWDEFLSELAGRRVRLARCSRPGDGHDVYPVTLVSMASLSALGTELDGRPVDARRFRLNLTMDIGDVPFLEDVWEGQSLKIGSCVLRLRGGIPRCLAVEYRPDDADRGLQMQRRIREVRGATPSPWGPSVLFGVYAEVVDAGILSVGDAAYLGD